MTAPDLVTVVIPAYNAEQFIDGTLRSVRAQTHRTLEIVVVDDGSTDGTTAIVGGHAHQDSRVRLIRQKNGGVAAARNRAIAEARGQFIAPIDADDLWAPDKIEKQIVAMHRSGPLTGLVYSWQATIDEEGRVIHGFSHRPTASGNVLCDMLSGNLVGSGSAALIRTEAIRRVGGYDASLRARKAQGCEDYKLYLQIASHYEFAVVEEFLTGYRQMAGNMSSDLFQMLRSYDIVADEAAASFPHHANIILKGRAYMRRYLWHRALRARAPRMAGELALELVRCHPRIAVGSFVRSGLGFSSGVVARVLKRRRPDAAPEEDALDWFTPRLRTDEAQQ